MPGGAVSAKLNEITGQRTLSKMMGVAHTVKMQDVGVRGLTPTALHSAA